MVPFCLPLILLITKKDHTPFGALVPLALVVSDQHKNHKHCRGQSNEQHFQQVWFQFDKWSIKRSKCGRFNIDARDRYKQIIMPRMTLWDR